MRETAAEVTDSVAKEMGDILLQPPLEPEADFFLLGGDSLRAVELINRLCARYAPRPQGEEPELAARLLLAMFDEATPAGVASIILETTGSLGRD
ncbi:phosphopantetheine-binding protein [Sphaerisporangium sp. NPDC005288]|uniref:phosphopantetheine-binding protein n=1 Tax=Sphaerisporangium sp. NPDC005288 TaxID=3155114 RepID=UPI0033B30957